MNYTIHKGIRYEDIKRTVPARFPDLLDSGLSDAEEFTVIVFSGSVVIGSRKVQSMLKELGDGVTQSILVFAHSFTEESRDLLQNRCARIYTEREWYRTEAQHSKFRNHRSQRKL